MRGLCLVLLCLSLTVTAKLSRGQEPFTSTRGTLITALGNKQGIVVMTDSRASIVDARGQIRPAPDHPIRKLLQYDEHIVCATAGLWNGVVRKPSEPKKEILPKVDLQVLGLVQSYRDAVKRAQKQQTMAETLDGLSAIIRGRFNAQAELDAYVGSKPADITSKYLVQVILAGTDTDGEQKIGRIEISVKRERWPDGQLHWTARKNESSCRLNAIKDALLICSAGIEGTELAIRGNPERYTKFPEIREYISANKKDHGSSLSLTYMKKLGHFFKVQTANGDARVGGDDQIATLPKGEPVEMEGIGGFPPFREPVPILMVICAPGAVISGEGEIISEVPMIFQSCTFSRFRVYLDGNIYMHCVFHDSWLFYSGGDNTLFEDDNRIVGESFLQGSLAGCRHADVMEQLAKRFDFQHGGNAWEGPGNMLPFCPSPDHRMNVLPPH